MSEQRSNGFAWVLRVMTRSGTTMAHGLVLAAMITGTCLTATAQEKRFGPGQLSIGSLIYESWLNYAAGEAGCRPGSDNERAACANRKGYTLKLAMQTDCMFTVTDRVPRPPSLRTDWEGKVAQDYVLAREVIIPLRELDRSLIVRTIDNRFSLNFEIKPDSQAYRKVLLSSSPERWITLPNPPTVVDVSGGVVGSDEHYQALMSLRAEWARKTELFDGTRGPDLPFITVSNAFENELTNSPQGLELLQSNRERIFIKYRTLGYNEPKRTATVDLIKTILRECPQQE